MTRRLRPLQLPDFEHLPTQCVGCAFWETEDLRERKCGAAYDPTLQEEWFHRVLREWGECGRLAREDDQILGFVKYAPSRYFPQALTFGSAPTDLDVPLIACLHVSEDARHHGLGTVLLRAALRDLVSRGERKVQAFGAVRKPAIVEESPMLGVDFLLRNGFAIVRPDPSYPLLEVELRSLVTWTENLESALESLKLPLRIGERAPAAW
jgi:ribosomal protein S18 acetylase RimI-like enzyme